MEKDISSKVITNSVLLVGDRTDYINGLCGNIINNVVGNITFTVEPSGWAGKKEIDVYYKISNNADKISNYTYDYVYDTVDNIEESGNFSSRNHQEVVEVNENGNLVAQIKNGDKLIVSNIQKISQIDDILPNADIKDNSNSVSNTQNVLLEMSDDESGLKEYYFGQENNSLTSDSWTETTGNQNSSVNEPGTWYLRVRDKAENETIVSKEFYETTLSIENASVSYNKLITIEGKTFTIPVPEANNGYYFVGWYTKEDYSGSAITKYTATGNTTLYGKVIKNVTVPIANTYCKSGLKYNGREQVLTNDPEKWYTFSNNKGTNAGSYTVTATLNGDYVWADDNSKTDKTLTCSISKADITPTVTISSYTYGGTKSNPSISGNTGSGTVTYYYNKTNNNSGGTAWSNVTSATSLNAGTYYMYATVGETTNYNAVTTGAVSFTINKANCVCEIGSVPTTMKYPSAVSGNITYTCGGDGTIGVTSGTTSVITRGTVGTNTTTLTAVDSGTSIITVSRGVGTNYNACTSDSETVTVSASTYTISYDLAGGSVSTANPTSYTTTTNTFTLNNPTRTGYTFTGWTGSNGTTPSTSVTITKGSTGNKNYTANWKINKVYINYSVNGGKIASSAGGYTWTTDSSEVILKNGSKETYSVNYGGSLGTDGLANYNNSSYINITKKGYSAVSGAEWKCLSGCSKSNATFNHSKVYNASDFCDASNGDCTVVLGVNWKAITYKISYNANGGSGTTADSYHTYDVSKKLTLNGFSKQGYRFTGWATSDTGNVKYSDGQSVVNLSSGDDVTLYAKWCKIYEIVFDADGGSVVPSKLYVCHGEYYELPTPKRSGHSFLYWGKADMITKCGTYSEYSAGDDVFAYESRTYVAVWDDTYGCNS